MSTFEFKGSIPEIIRNEDNLYEGNLISYFRAVFNDARNLCNPYHNFRHMCHVTYLCYQACVFYKSKLNKREMRNLLIAALFHDFDHTGKSSPDKVNINRAIKALKSHLAEEDRDQFDNIAEIIQATKWPYTKEPANPLGMIIRDADMSQGLTIAWIQQVVFGLATEWDKTPLEILKIQPSFLKEQEFRTTWAKQAFPKKYIKQKISEIQSLINLLVDY